MYFFASEPRISATALRLTVIPAILRTGTCRSVIILLFTAIFSAHETRAQEYGYRHYEVKDGLAGSSVYDIYQDKEGFLWAATETGVSRFDGTHFKNFTVNDGLPDNAIIRIYGDSKGRIWLVPFKHAICYYYRGKIYNQQNDTALQKIRLTEYVLGISEDANGIVWLLEVTGLYRIGPSNEVTLARQLPKGLFLKISKYDSENWLIAATGDIYRVNEGKWVRYDSMTPDRIGGADQVIAQGNMHCWLKPFDKVHIKVPARNLDYEYNVPPVNTLQYYNDSIICLNTTRGTMLLNIVTRKIEKHFLATKHVSKCLTDAEGGLWFSTLNEGIYHLPSTMLTTFKAMLPNGQKLGVNDLQKYNNAIWAALDMGYLLQIHGHTTRLTAIDRLQKRPMRDAVSAIKVWRNRMAIGNSNDIYLQKGDVINKGPSMGVVKDIAWKSDTEMVVACSNGLCRLSLNRQGEWDILWMGRTTCLFLRNDSIYFGTLNGLYVLTPDKKVFSFGDTSRLLQSRISAIQCGADGTVWVATSGEGVIELKANRIVRQLKEQDGLCSNLVRCMAVDTGCIWVGTDRGLNKIDLCTNPVTITKYASSDGLPSDIINTLLVDGDTLYAGTPDGIACFNKKEQLPSSKCHLRMLAVYREGKEAPEAGSYILQYGENDIRFDYVAISFKAANDIVYAYRLNGADTSWKTTRQTSLEFISLPPGKYKFELRAINKFGISSALYTAELIVQAPYWQTSWFFIGCLAATAGITWSILSWRNNYKKSREAEKRKIEQELLELEQKALRAQMNPHFIFNCLNSVQGYILDNDMASANKYLNRFAHLIRQTLDNSLQSLVTVADEIQYINTYLNLEQMRFKNKFTFTIQHNLPVDPSQLSMPGMLLQPFIENAILHGMQHRPDGNGHIGIHFYCQDKMIGCVIEDNGIGRKKAMTLKAARPVEYQSRGMRLVRERIQILNKGLDTPISVQITDREDERGLAAGTTVQIRFPEIKADYRN